MPMDRSKYPADWEEISIRIRYHRAGNKCETCGAPNGRTIGRRLSDEYRWSLWANIPTASRHLYRPVKIVLTVAHLDHDTTHNDDDNLRALCQRCHLKYDAAHHAANAAETRRRKAAEAGQLDMGIGKDMHAGEENDKMGETGMT